MQEGKEQGAVMLGLIGAEILPGKYGRREEQVNQIWCRSLILGINLEIETEQSGKDKSEHREVGEWGEGDRLEIPVRMKNARTYGD